MKQITSLTTSENGLIILVNGHYNYHIPTNTYLDSYSNNHSGWILHLIDKQWMDLDSLYEIGLILQSEDSESKINWLQTFEAVEKHYYINNISRKQKKGESLSKYVLYKILLAREFPVTDFAPIVQEKFKQYGFRS